MKKICSFGELLIRFSPEEGQWLSSGRMAAYLGGSELNVACALAKWGMPSRYVTCLPDHSLARAIVADLASRGVDVAAIQWSGDRIGLYFITQGADLKHGSVIYDRAHSAFADLGPEVVNWDQVLQGSDWFHFSAISPALSERAALLCQEAVKAAFAKKLSISVDLNYRARLWQYGKNPLEVMPRLVDHCTVIMGNIWSASTLLGIPLDPRTSARLDRPGYLELARQSAAALFERFPRCRVIALTFRMEEPGGRLRYYAALSCGHHFYPSEAFEALELVDQVGTGDCFMAGLIYGLCSDWDPTLTINFAASAGFGKFFERGDRTNQDLHVIKSRIAIHG